MNTPLVLKAESLQIVAITSPEYARVSDAFGAQLEIFRHSGNHPGFSVKITGRLGSTFEAYSWGAARTVLEAIGVAPEFLSLAATVALPFVCGDNVSQKPAHSTA